ncbi:MAG: trypsin-like serine protease [Spirulina sp.]
MPNPSTKPSTISPFYRALTAKNDRAGSRREPRIIGGVLAGDGAYPWMAALVRANDANNVSAQFSGGTLIASQWILTAAHSVDGLNPGDVEVLLGTNSLGSGGTRHSVAEIILNDQYNPATFEADLALLRLETPITGVTPLELVGFEDPYNQASAGIPSTAIGWGALSDGGPSATRLYEVEVPIVSNQTANHPQSYNGDITDNMLAAGLPEGGKDSSQGDSGGPLIIREGDRDIQVGIVSFGIGSARPNFYGIYTRVSAFTDWIDNLVGLPPAPTGFSVANLSIRETNADQTVQLTVNLTNAPTDANAPITIEYEIANGTAIAPDDYDAGMGSTLTGTLSFDAGEDSKTIDLVIKGDRDIEPTEHFTITLQNASDDQIVRATARISILDNDSPPIARGDSGATIPNTPIVIPVLLNDTDSNGQAIRIESFDPVSTNGGRIFQQDNLLIYTPPPGFLGNDRFTYRISNEEGRTDSAIVKTVVLAPRRFIDRRGARNPLDPFQVQEFSHPVLVDINGDGKLDVFVGKGNGNLDFLENIGTPTKPVFAPPQTNPFNLAGVGQDSAPTFVDIDGDGDFDAFVGNSVGNVLFFENQGTATTPDFRAPQTNPFNWQNAGTYAAPVFADLDGDGDFDVLVGTALGEIYYLKNLGTPQAPNFDQPLLNPFGLQGFGGFSAPSVADIDADGDLDLLVGRNQPGPVYFNNIGNATNPDFIPVFGLPDPFRVHSTGFFSTPTFGDIDGDKDLDLFLGNDRGTITYLENFGTDGDGDEVPDQMERVAGDRNLDGILDAQQANVVSFASFNGDPGNPQTFITLATPFPETRFLFAEAIDNPAPGRPGDPLGRGTEFPFDFFNFRFRSPSSPVVLTLILPEEPENPGYNTFWVYGPEPNDRNPHWFEFVYDGRTGAQFFDLDGNGKSEFLLLHYTDNQRGDLDFARNSITSVNAAGTINEPLTLAPDRNDTFSVTGTGGFASLEFTLQPSDSDRVSEVGIFKVDDRDRVNGATPGQDHFKDTALRAGTTIFDVLSNKSDDLIGGLNLTRNLPIAPGDRFMFYFITKGTRDTILRGDPGKTEVYFSSTAANDDNFDHLRVTGGNNAFTLAWEESEGGDDTDYADLVMSVRLDRSPLSLQDLAANAQGGRESELIDLRNLDGQNIRAFIPTVRSEAAFENTVGLYRIEDETGTVRHPITGQLITPGASGYIEASLLASQQQGGGISFDRHSGGAAITLRGGSLFAPFIIANGTLDQLLDSDASNDRPVYFAFANGNSDTRDHIQLLGNNIYGFEDLPELGDEDFNDIIFQVEVAIA